jgi:hypothetical protein
MGLNVFALFAGFKVAQLRVQCDAHHKARLARQIDRVNARDLPEFVHEVLKLWLVKKDSYTSFSACVDGEGTQAIRVIADRFRTVPEFSVDKLRRLENQPFRTTALVCSDRRPAASTS